MNIAISQEFLDCISGVPPHVAKKTRETISRFRIAPQSAGLNYERINGARDKNFRSIRMDQDYRIILWASPEGGNHVFLWLDHHDAAYAWSRNRRVEVNPELGALQIYQVAEALADVAPAHAENQPAPGLFDTLRDRELMRLGVPQELTETVRGVHSETELDSLEGIVPPMAFQGLFLVAAGYTYEEAVAAFERPEPTPVSADSETLLSSAESRTAFFLVEDDQILEEMFNAPLEKWRVFLHPSQQRLIERDWNGPVKVTGGPGTGKTVAALHRARWLSARLPRGSSNKILVTTFTKNLARDISNLLACICSTDELARIEVRNIDAVARDVLRKYRFDQTIMFEGSDEIEELWAEALKEIDTDDLPASFYRTEWAEVLQPQQIRDLESYKAASRVGRKTRLTRSQLIQAWPVFQTYMDLLVRHGWMESQDAFFAAARFLGKDEPPYSSVIVDETQDMGIPALTFLRALVPEQQNDLFLVGDAHQSIYSRKTVLSRAGINVRGRSRRLLLNYRTTEQIGRWAMAWITGGQYDDLDGAPENLRGYRSLISGSMPLDLRPLVPEEKLARIHDLLSATSEADRSSTCIVLPSRELVREWSENLGTWGFDYRIIDEAVDTGTIDSRIALATIHRVKGLEFDRIIVRLPHPSQPNFLSLGFVAVTRARKELVLM